jgi:hypothetical protein
LSETGCSTTSNSLTTACCSQIRPAPANRSQHRGNYGVYGVIDQQLYRLPGGDWQGGVPVFSRASFSPSDRNQINAYIDVRSELCGLKMMNL